MYTDKFKNGDILRCIEPGDWPDAEGRLARVTGYEREFVEVFWLDRNAKANSRSYGDGGFHEWMFELVPPPPPDKPVTLEQRVLQLCNVLLKVNAKREHHKAQFEGFIIVRRAKPTGGYLW